MGVLRTFALLAVVLALGCKKGPTVEVPKAAENPPVWDGNGGTFAAWLEGKWCPSGETNPQAIEKFGIEPVEGIDVSQHWVFKADGTFTYGKLGYKDVIGGRWIVSSNGVELFYETWDNETISEKRARLLKDAESGTQGGIMSNEGFEMTMRSLDNLRYFEVNEDRKSIFFTTMGESMALLDAGDLVRMQ